MACARPDRFRCVALAAATLLGACAINPVSGRLEVSLTSEAREIEIGRRAAASIERQVGLLPASELSRYVERLGGRLVEVSPRKRMPYSFRVLDLAEPNAFALPGGVIYVSRGLLAVTNSEDELAGVIAHEIGHVAAKHAVQRITRAAPLNIVTGLAAGVTSIVSEDAAGAIAGVGGLANATLNAPFDREQENEADAVGQTIAAAAGWDPGAVTTFLETLDETVRHIDGERGTTILATHPPTLERIAKTRARAAELPRTPHRPLARDRGAFLAMLDGLVVGPDPVWGVFDDTTYVQPRLGYRIVFPAGWRTGSARHAAAAATAEGDALLIVQPAGPGRALEVARAALGGDPDAPPVELVEIEVGGAPAVTAELSAEEVRAQLTWVERSGEVYLVLGIARAARYGAVRAAFTATAHSFGPPSAEELSAVSVVRLRIATARAGERLSELATRAASAVDLPTLALINGLAGDPVLDARSVIKVPTREPYVVP